MDPVLRWYEARGLLLRIDGAGDPAQVTGRILAAIRLRKR
jgi:adenylate kinase family enzyme